MSCGVKLDTEAFLSQPHHEYIKQLANAAPPLTNDRLERIARVLRGGARR